MRMSLGGRVALALLRRWPEDGQRRTRKGTKKRCG
jgi:hypothetical protein